MGKQCPETPVLSIMTVTKSSAVLATDAAAVPPVIATADIVARAASKPGAAFAK